MITSKFHSDVLNRDFNTEKEAVQAEKEHKEKLEQIEKQRQEQKKKDEALKLERADRVKEVNEAFELANAAYNEARKKLNAFIKDYGSYHASFSASSYIKDSFSDFFDNFLNFRF